MKVLRLLVLSLACLALGWFLRGALAPIGPPGSPTAGADAPVGEGAAAESWTCSMHPQVQRSGPGSCPLCGMDLIPANQPTTSALDTASV